MPERLRQIVALVFAALSPYPLVAYLIGTQGRFDMAFPILKAAGMLHAAAFLAYLFGALIPRFRDRSVDRTVYLTGLVLWAASLAFVAVQILSR
ncbi:MAG TPA: hypothetical protein VGE01_09705 [Fimbriimonas sp.]